MRPIDRNSTQPFYQQVYEQFSTGIATGVYRAGTKLPSIRACAQTLGVSNTTVELAYQMLVAEGYICARRGSGFVVCAQDDLIDRPRERFSCSYHEALDELVQAKADGIDGAEQEPLRYDFRFDAQDPALFPAAILARIARDVLFSEGADQACRYNDEQGLPALRRQISEYAGIEHDISCVPEQVLVMPTTCDLVSSVSKLFEQGPRCVSLEDPGRADVARTLSERGFDVQPIPVWPLPTWDDVEKSITGSKLLYTTPPSQFPAIQSMPLEARRKLVNWAQANDAYILDDERGLDYQSGIERMPPLAAFDRDGHVITLGSFANTLSPATCICYAILPPQLMLQWRKLRDGAHAKVPWHAQALLAAFMADGQWPSHLRKMRTALARKRTLVLDALNARLAERVEVVANSGSLFVLVATIDGRGEAELVSAARDEGIGIYPTRCFWRTPVPSEWRYVMVGFSSIAEADIAPGIDALASAWGY